jgi:nanoRNase/pAp phosphatase (c-di-AMP/oligoRNAs hydrolase)
LRPWQDIDPRDFDVTALVDTQPGTGNNSFPNNQTPDVVIDHHPIRKRTRRSPFTDVRSRYGATATIMYEYLLAAEVPIDMPLATALLYGIGSDTQDLGREAAAPDIDAYTTLYPVANTRMLSRIRSAPVPRAYFRVLNKALVSARVYGNVIVADLGKIDHPDMIGEVADLLLRAEGAAWALCHGVFSEQLLLSLRGSEGDTAGEVMARIVRGKGTGGGHNTLAGGQIPLADASREVRAELEKVVMRRFLKVVEEDENGSTDLLGGSGVHSAV